MLPSAIVQDDVDLSRLNALHEADLERQRSVVKAREYHDGEQTVFLTARSREFLGLSLESDARFNLNVCRTVVEALSERLMIEGFETGDDVLKEWAMAVWRGNKMDARADDTHEMAVRDGESFVIVDWDFDLQQARLTPHPAYTSVEAGGDGFGFVMVYPEDDVSQPPLYAIKRWVELMPDNRSRMRATYYFPNRIEKYAYAAGWVKVQDEEDVDSQGGDVWPLPWVDSPGQPLGVPVFHFKNKGLRSEAWDALPVQDAINKMLLDVLAASDMTGFRMLVILGFIPTTDDQPLNGDGSNALTVAPGQMIGTTKNARDVDVKAIDGADPTPLVNVLQKLIQLCAMVTNTPTGRFQLSGLVSSEQSQKQAEEPLMSKVRNRQSLFGDAWESVLDMARRLQAVHSTPVDVDAELTVVWAPAQTQSAEERKSDIELKKLAGIPRRQLWSELGYDQEKIDEMLKDPEVTQASFFP